MATIEKYLSEMMALLEIKKTILKKSIEEMSMDKCPENYLLHKKAMDGQVLTVDTEFLDRYEKTLALGGVFHINELDVNRYGLLKSLKNLVTEVQQLEHELIQVEHSVFPTPAQGEQPNMKGRISQVKQHQAAAAYKKYKK